MSRRTRRLSSLVAVAAIVTVPIACGSSGSSSKSTDGATTTTAAAATTAAGSSATTTTASGENPGEPTLADGKADADHTVTFSGGAWSPSKVTVAKGELVTFVADKDAGTVAVTFNGNDSFTLSGGLVESFTFDEPGTYTAKEFLSGTPMTIEVTG